MTKIRQDNGMTDCIGLVYFKIETKLSRPIRLGAVYEETKQNNYVIDLPRVVYVENESELL